MKSSDTRSLYDQAYFLSQVDGFDQYEGFDGSYEKLYWRYQRNVELSGLRADESLLEVGCGRGEICLFHSLRGGRAVGVDYSKDAIRLAQLKAAALHSCAHFVAAPFAQAMQTDEHFDCILASEFIEHIAPDEAITFMRLAFDRLTPGGRLFVFTYPNTLQRKYGYRLLRWAGRLRGRQLPARQPDTLNEHYKLFHLNEQNRFSLLRLARLAGFSECSVGYDNGPQTRAARAVMASPFRDLFGTDLYLIARKAIAKSYAT